VGMPRATEAPSPAVPTNDVGVLDGRGSVCLRRTTAEVLSKFPRTDVAASNWHKRGIAHLLGRRVVD